MLPLELVELHLDARQFEGESFAIQFGHGLAGADEVAAFPVSALLSKALLADVWANTAEADEDDPDVFDLRDEVGEARGAGVSSVDELMTLLTTSLGVFTYWLASSEM